MLRWIVGGALCVVAGCATGGSRPNVIVVVLDTVRRDHLGCYGYARDTSPNLDRFAAQAVVYERAVSAAPWTLPSHATLFTGLLPSRHQAHHEHLRLADDRVTIAERLAAAGYETIGFCNNPWITGGLGMTQGFQRFDEVWRDRVAHGGFSLNIFVNPEKHGMDDAGAATSFRAIENWLAARDDSRPFFLFVNLVEAHAYFDPPAPYRGRFFDQDVSREAVKQANLVYFKEAYADQLEPQTRTRIQGLYDGEIAYLDEWIGRFTAMIDREGLLDRSLIVFTADHGEAFAEHRSCGLPLIDHQLSLYSELVDVPLVIRYPSASAQSAANGTRVPTPVSSTDLFPTILNVVGLDPGEGLDGISLAGTPPPEGRPLFTEYYRPIVHLGLLNEQIQDKSQIDCLANRRLVAVHSGRLKVIAGESIDAPAIFDLVDDPEERSPRAPAASGVEAELAALAVERLRTMQDGPELAPPTLDDAWREALQSLGYLK